MKHNTLIKTKLPEHSLMAFSKANYYSRLMGAHIFIDRRDYDFINDTRPVTAGNKDLKEANIDNCQVAVKTDH